MDQLITNGQVQRAALGIRCGDATENDAAYVGLPEIRGVMVTDFPDGMHSPAKQAGLEPGDVIIAVDGKPVSYVAQLQQVVGFRRPGEVVKVEVARKGGVRKTFTVRLMEQAGETREANAGEDPAGAVGEGRIGEPYALGNSVRRFCPPWPSSLNWAGIPAGCW